MRESVAFSRPLIRSSAARWAVRASAALLFASLLFLPTSCPDPNVGDSDPPGPVTNFNATPGDTSVTLTWTEPGDADYAELRITGTPGSLAATVAKGTTTHTFSSLANGTEYTFTARAADDSGNLSTEVSDTATPAIPGYTLAGSFTSISVPLDPANLVFNGPRDVALDASGNFIVADTGNHCVKIIGSDGVTKLATLGRTDGQPGSDIDSFDTPSGVLVCGDGILYVADTGNNRIRCYTYSSTSPTYAEDWGPSVDTFGQLLNPIGLACDVVNIYVSDSGHDRILVFDHSGVCQRQWTGVSDPRGLFLYSGYLYVADYGNARIARILTAAADTSSVEAVALDPGLFGAFTGPYDVAINASNTYVSDALYSRLLTFSTTTGSANAFWNSAGAFRGMVLDAANSLLVAADATNHRVARLTTAFGGTSQPNVGGPYLSEGQLSNPWDVASSPDGNAVYVTDYGYHRVLVYNAEGTSLTARWGGLYGTSGTANGSFNAPRGIAVGPEPDGKVYVADTANHRVQVFAADGTFSAAWGSTAPSSGTGDGAFNSPYDIAVAADGTYAFVTDRNNERLQKFTSAGGFVSPVFSATSDQASGDSPRYKPLGIALDSAGTGILVCRTSYGLTRLGIADGAIQSPDIYSETATFSITRASDVETDSDGNIYLAVKPSTSMSYEIRKYSSDGILLATLPKPTGGLSSVGGIGVVPLGADNNPGRVYVAEETSKTIYFFDPPN